MIGATRISNLENQEAGHDKNEKENKHKMCLSDWHQLRKEINDTNKNIHYYYENNGTWQIERFHSNAAQFSRSTEILKTTELYGKEIAR